MGFSTVPEMFLSVCERSANQKPAILHKKDGQYVGIKHQELLEMAARLTVAFIDLGIHSGDRVGIISENRLEWMIVDFALTSLGAINVPVFPTLTSKQLEFVFNDCEASVIVVSNDFQLKKLLEVKDNIPSIRHIIVLNDKYDSELIMVKSYSSLMKRSEELKSLEDCIRIFKKYAKKVNSGDLLTIIYTSGTTGNPKGVMLSHNNIISNVIACYNIIHFDENDTLLSFLPWCHSYERTTGYYAFFSVGATVAIAEAIETVGTNILEVKPTIMTTVPRLLETIKKKIYHNIEREKPVKQKIFHWAVAVGKSYIKHKIAGKEPIALKLQYNIADKLVFSKIREKTGGRLKKFVSGGAALSPDVAEFFLAAGVMIIEGYGLTEASPVVAVTRENNFEIGTIGLPLDGVEVRIAEDGELLVRGPNVMVGYWNDPLSTEKAIDKDGWLYTGDVGIFTEKNNIKITDRKKDIIVTSGGKNVAPQPIENILSASAFVEHVLLIGDRREFCTALITPNFEHLKSIAELFEIEYENETQLISNPKIIQAIKLDLDRLQKDLAKYERVRKFKLLSQPFSVENGELTPKMSIRRHVVERKYNYLIEEMYNLS